MKKKDAPASSDNSLEETRLGENVKGKELEQLTDEF
jgi:hypothetical protein